AITNGGNSPVYQWKVNGVNAGTNSSTFITSSLLNNDVVSCQLTSNAACPASTVTSSNSILMTVTPAVTPSISISSPITTICSGTSLTFTAVATNGGSSPSYQWKVNGSNAGTNSSTFTTSTLNNNDVVSCVLTSNANCAAPTTATSNAVTVTVTGTVAPTVSVSPSATSICSGQPVTFTATATNGGASPGYQWKVNGVNQSGSTNTFNSSTLLNNDTVRVVLTSSSGCASPATATSLPIVMTVNPNSSPSITISTSTTTVCNGTQTTFTATATNAGSSPTYQWKVNGTNAGTNSSTFSTFALSNNDSVWCTVTSASACAVPNNATSNKIKMTVVPNVTPSVSIATTTNSICSGNTAVFTATASNGGASPSYQWKVNGLNAGTNNASFSSATLNDNDVISCVLTSNAACATPATATSNAITMSVGSSLPASVSISASATTVCSGVSVTFTATPTNGGVAPLYQWKVNGLNVGSNSSSYSSSTLSNNDVVSCQVTSSSACANPATAGSNAITMTITPAVTPSISISSPITTICSGTSLTFTAVATNGGSSPSYQWKVNGSNAGTNSSTFTTSTLNNNDVVSCSITSNASCLSVTTATSNSITVTGSGAQPSVSISTTTAAACAGTAVVFTATVTNPGTSQSYQWKVNGLNAGTGASFSSTTLQNGDTVVCVATVNSACLGAVVVTSNKIGVSITPTVSPSVAITASQNGICSGTTVTFNAVSTNAGTSPVYVWKVNGVAVGTNASVLVASTLSNQDTVTCTLQSSAICAVPAVVVSNRVIMNITPQVTPSITISTQSLSVCQGSTVTFNATIANGGVNPIYRWTIDGLAAGSSAATLTTSALSNGSIVKCMLISSANCALPDSIVSNTLTITHAAPVTPAVAIVSTGTNTCQGALQSFAATASNGGTSPVYSWLVNGLATGIQTSTFSSDSLHQGDVITCRLTSSVGCVTSTTVQSNSLNVTVTPSVVPTISIATATTNICFGALVNFTASITNGGSAPAYQWYVDGTAVGANSSSYSNSTLFDGNTVYCRVISNAVCAAAGGTTSNPITMSVTTTAAPTVAVTSSADSICSGGNVTFTATAANAGTNPVYQWKVNGIAAGSNAATFAGTTFNNNDQIVVTVTSSAGCNSGASVTSNPKVVRVLQPVTPTVAISTNDTVICAGTNVVFHAQASNTGSNPVYQWRVNGANTGNTSAVFASNTLNNNDQVSVKLSSNAMCATSQVVVSNTVTLAVTPLVSASVAIAANPNDTICAGTQLLFTATAVNGGATPVYQWQVNGIPVGTNSDSYASNSWSDQDIVTVQMQSSAFCVSQNPVLALPVTLTVYDLPAAPVVSHQGNVLQSSAPAGNQWYRAAAPISGATAATYTINNSGWYSVKVTDMHGCSNRGDSVFVNYNGIAEIDWNKQVTVLPNPFEEEFTIAVSAEVLKNREWNVTVTTAGGQTIYTAAIHEMRTNIILQDAPGGVYFVNLRSGNDLKTYRVVKLH
ncbi:MAG: T9SS type A sorting domain-containing protein, partial [Chitinophagales bacterium]